jgi:hypothetical protein
MRELVGYEVRKDKKGNLQEYVNPYMAYLSMQAFPFLRTYLNVPYELEKSGSPLLATMNLLLGVQTQSVDFPKQQEYVIKEQQGKIVAVKQNIKQLIQNNPDIESNKKAYEKLQQLRNELSSLMSELGQLNQVRLRLMEQAESRSSNLYDSNIDPQTGEFVDPTTGQQNIFNNNSGRIPGVN